MSHYLEIAAVNDFVQPALSMIGVALGAYLGVRLAIAKLESQLEAVKIDIKENLKPEIAKLRDRVHDHQNRILIQDGRLASIEHLGRRDIR